MKQTKSKTGAVSRRAIGSVLRAENGDVRIAVSSETPCRDEVYMDGAWRDCYLTLSHEEGAVDMERVRDGIALKDGHWSDTIVARAMNPDIEDGKLCSHEIVWSAAADAQVMKQDFESGVLRDISVEAYFNYSDCEKVGEREGILDVVVRKWTPLCAAFVVNGADPNAGIARGLGNTETGTAQTSPATEAQPPAATPAATTVTVKEEKKHMDPKDIQKVYDLARKFNIAGDTISAWLGEGKTVDQVREAILADIAARSAKPAPATQTPDAGIPAKEIRKYSLIKAIRSMLPVGDGERIADAGLERECSQEIARKLKRDPHGIFIPVSVLARQFDSGAEVGGALIPTEYLGSAFIEKIRSKLVLALLGVRNLTGLSGDVAIPKQTDSATGYYIDNESEGVPDTAPKTGLVGLSPKTYGARTLVTRKMLKQTGNPSADGFVQEDLVEVCARGVQSGVLYGTGADGQPAGLASLIAKTTVAPSFEAIVNMEGDIETPNDEENVKFLCNRKTFGRLRLISKDVGSGQFLAYRERGNKYIDDIPTFTTSDVAANELFLGDWSQLILALWGTLDITVNPFIADDRGAVVITALQDFDCGIRHAESFKYVGFTAGA